MWKGAMGSGTRRRLGGNARVLRKKKVKMSKRGTSVDRTTGGIFVAPSMLAKKKGPRLRLKKTSARVSSGNQRPSALKALCKQRSQLLKRQAAERMVLKEHTRELEARRQRIRKGENAKTERRELGKYIRQLQEEQKTKQNAEILIIEEQMKLVNGKASSSSKMHVDGWVDVDDEDDDGGDGEEICEEELERMFAHLTM